MKRLLCIASLVVTLFVAPGVWAEPQESSAVHAQLSQIVAGWFDWILQTLEPAPETATSPETTTTPELPPPPPPSGQSGGEGDPGYGGVIVPGG